jgi:hypothetical protein
MSEPNTSVTQQAELDELRMQNKILSREIITLNQSHDSILNGLVMCQGLLAQFMLPKVRQAFIVGKFDVECNSDEVLLSLDVIREVLLPYPSSAKGKAVTDHGAVQFIMNLLSKDAGEPTDSLGVALPYRQSFGAWRTLMHSLMSSNAWKSLHDSGLIDDKVGSGTTHLPPGNRDDAKSSSGPDYSKHFCTKDMNFGSPKSNRVKYSLDRGEASGFHKGHAGEGAVSELASGFVELKSDVVGRRSGFHYSKDVNHNRRPHVQSKSSRRAEVKISVTSSEESNSGGSSDSDGSSESEPSERCRGRHRVRRFAKAAGTTLADALRSLKVTKEVVRPSSFNSSSGVSLKRFLSDFERYFESKFEGTGRDMSVQLGKFLEGSVRNAYDAMGGSHLHYSKLKPRLLEWYGSERPSVRQKKFDEFQAAKLRGDDTLTIYAMRLEQLALKAFPDSVTERERQLRKKFRQTVPSSFIAKLDNALSALAMFGEKKLSWSRIKQLGEAEDRLTRERKEDSVPFDQYANANAKAIWFSRNPSVPQDVKRDDYQPKQPSDYRGARPKTFQNTVFHKQSSPPRFRPNSCSSPTSASRPICWYCGREGHIEMSCWLKQGACELCGGLDHNKNKCPKYFSRHGAMPLKCSLCGGDHLGKDCPRHEQRLLNH